MLSIGSIVGAGFFVGVSFPFALAGPRLMLSFLLVSAVAVIV